jgi:diacylglycerol kinase family enzyme
MPGIGVVTNPRSKANRRDPAGMRRLAYLLGTRGEAQATESLDDLYRAAEQFRAAGIDVLGIHGGDGTLHVTLTAFIQVYGLTPLPKIAILGGGTLNTIARGLRIRGRPNDILYQVIERNHEGKPFTTIARPIMQIGEKYGFIFGNGLIAHFLEAYYATGRPSPSTGALLLGRAAASAVFGTGFTRRLCRRLEVDVTVDGKRWAEHDFATITCGTVPEIGIGFAPYARCMGTLEKFALVGFHCQPTQLVWELPKIYRGQTVAASKAETALAREMLIESAAEIPYVIDGDLHRQPAGTLRVATGPVLEIIVPDGGIDLG